MRIKVLMLLFLVLVLTACFEQERFHFEGSSDSWEVNYDLEVAVKDDSEQGTIKMNYVGEDEAPDRIDYELKESSGVMSGGDISLEGGFLETPGSNCSGCAVTQKDDEFDVTIDWEGKQDNFTLKNQD